MRARWSILRTGMVVNLREVDLKSKPKELLELSPKGTVPVLLTEEGLVIDESIDIIKWSLERFDHHNILRNNNKRERDQVELLVRQNDEYFKRHIDRYKYSSRYPDENIEFHREAAVDFLLELEQRLKGTNQKRRWLVGDAESLADWAIWPFVRQFWNSDLKRLNNDNRLLETRKWLESFCENPLFDILMIKQKSFPSCSGENNFPNNSSSNVKEETLYHLALPSDWEIYKNESTYKISTRGMHIDAIGYIHLAYSSQLNDVYHKYYRDLGTIILLVIDVKLLNAVVRLDLADDGISYPHVYGPIPASAIIRVETFP